MKVTSVQLVGFVTPGERSKLRSPTEKNNFLSHNPSWKWYCLLSEERRPYFLDHLSSHLPQDSEKLYTILTDVNFLTLRLAECGIEKLQRDYDRWNSNPDPVIDLLKEVLQLANSILEYDPTQLPEQILARITNNETLKSLIYEFSTYKRTLWLRPLYPSLAQPGGVAIRTIPLSGKSLPSAVALTPDNEQVLVTMGNTLYCFDLKKRNSFVFLRRWCR